METRAKWKVSLSNGETLYEDKGNFCVIKGELSPWNRLLKYMEENNLSITSLSIYTDRGLSYNLPSIGKNPKFHAFSELEKPIGYKMFRKIAQDIYDSVTDHFTVIEAEYPKYKLQVWVNNNNPKSSWTLVV